MKPLHIVLGLASLLVVIFFVGGTLLPMVFEREAETEVCASPEQVHELFDQLETMAGWSIIGDAEEADFVVRGESGPGARLEWREVRESGDGAISLEITESVPARKVEYAVRWDEEIQLWLRADLEPLEDGEGTRVALSAEREVQSLSGRWLGWLIVNFPIGDDPDAYLEAELTALGDYAEERFCA